MNIHKAGMLRFTATKPVVKKQAEKKVHLSENHFRCLITIWASGSLDESLMNSFEHNYLIYFFHSEARNMLP